MAYQIPKTDWTADNGIANTDFNRIEGNIDYLEKGLHEFAVCGGIVNAYTATMSPITTSLYPGLLIRLPITITNTLASTVNVDTLGAKAIKNSDGTDVSAGDLMAGGIYSLIYNGTTAFILQGKGGVSSADLNALITIANEADSSNTTVNASITSKLGSPTVGGDSWIKIGNDIVTQKTNLAANLVSRGKTALSSESLKSLVDKTVKSTECLPANIAIGITIDGVAGAYKSANTVAGNIKAGVTIDGVAGNVTIASLGGKGYQAGSGTTNASGHAIITGLPFQPSIIKVFVTTPGYSYLHDVAWSATTALQENGPGTSTAAVVTNGFDILTSGGTLLAFTYKVWE